MTDLKRFTNVSPSHEKESESQPRSQGLSTGIGPGNEVVWNWKSVSVKRHQNAAARTVTHARKCDHIIPLVSQGLLPADNFKR